MKFISVFLLIGATVATTFAEVDVVLQDLGCWKEKINNPVIESWEAKDLILEDSANARVDAIQKCAKVAKNQGYKVFAIRDGGICATGPLAEWDYKKFGPSTDCAVTGKGGWEANQVYLIDTLIDAKFVPVGCWQPEIEDLIKIEKRFLRLMGDWQTRIDIEENCARAVAALGLEVFALQDGGECLGWHRNVNELKFYARSWECGPKKLGTKKGIEFYKITKLSNVTLVDLGCWKNDQLSPALPLIESRSKLLGERNHKIRPDAVEKCAIYNADWMHKIFAVTDGGACAGGLLEMPAYDALGPSNECHVSGKGAKDADQVYKIVHKVKDLKWEKWESFEPLYLTPLGCWVVKGAQLIPTLEGTDPLLSDDASLRYNAVERCAKAAQRRGFKVIALREGKCYSSMNARELYQTHGPSDECDPQLGALNAISVFEINMIREPWFSNEGCFQDCKEVELLEGLHPWLEDSPQSRLDPIRKCAQVAALWDYDSFSLNKGGVCHGLWWKATKNCKTSAACSDDGLGGRFSHQIYFLKAKNNFTIENMGCWKDDAFRTIPIAEGATLELTGRYTEREDAIGACARYARSRGFKVFALQSGGMCLTSDTAEGMFNWYGWSNDCNELGTGGDWANQVWRISEDWWKSPVDWWKVPEDWQKLGAWNCTWQWWKTPIVPLM